MKKFNDVHMRTPDSLNFFLGMGISLLNGNGYLGMIVLNNFLFQHEYSKSRVFFLKNFWLLQAINLGDSIFQNVTAPCSLVVFRAIKPDKNKKINVSDLRHVERNLLPASLEHIVFEEISTTEVLSLPDAIILFNKKTANLLSRILNKNYPTLDTLSTEVAAGIGTGGDKVFRIDDKTARKQSMERNILFPVIIGREIDAYKTPEDTGHYIIYATKKISSRTHPRILEYLKPFQLKLSQKRETKKGLIPWWSLHWPRYQELFNSPKIILRQTADSLSATIDSIGYYCLNSIIIIRLKDENLIPYITGLLNSKVVRWLYRNFTQESGRVFAEVKPINLRKLPLRAIDFKKPDDKASHDKIVALVDRMLELHKKKNTMPPSAECEKVEREIAVTDEKIDNIVYGLYEITDDERKIIEGI